MHILQLGYDTDSLKMNGHQDSWERQKNYADILVKNSPDARLTNIVLSDDQSLTERQDGALHIIPMPYIRLRHIRKLIKSIQCLHKERPIDLITTQDIHGMMWAGLCIAQRYKVPIIGQIHYEISSKDARDELWHYKPRWLYHFITRLFLRCFNAFRTVNHRANDYIRNHVKKNVLIKTIPVSVAFSEDRVPGTIWPIETAHPKILYIGRFERSRNLTLWIETASKIHKHSPETSFCMIGNGPEKQKIIDLIAHKGLEQVIHILDAQPYDLAMRYMKAADIFLFTPRHEGFGRVLIEAALCDTVVISTKAAGPEDIIESDYVGILTNHCEEEIEKKCIEILCRKERIREISQNARENISLRYNNDRLKKEWVDLLLSFGDSQEI